MAFLNSTYDKWPLLSLSMSENISYKFLLEALKMPFNLSKTFCSQETLTLEVLLIVIFGSEELLIYFTRLAPTNLSISNISLKSSLVIWANGAYFVRVSQRLLTSWILRRSPSNELAAFLKVS